MALKPNEIRFVAGDTLPALRGTLTEDDGTPVDLTGATVTLHINYATVLVKTASIIDAAAGQWQVDWQPTDLVAGKWTYEIQIDDGSGGVRTWNRDSTTDRQLTLVVDAEVA